jgi:hypothetical protein
MVQYDDRHSKFVHSYNAYAGSIDIMVPFTLVETWSKSTVIVVLGCFSPLLVNWNIVINCEHHFTH